MDGIHRDSSAHVLFYLSLVPFFLCDISREYSHSCGLPFARSLLFTFYIGRVLALANKKMSGRSIAPRHQPAACTQS